jgi:hypothetical protein
VIAVELLREFTVAIERSRQRFFEEHSIAGADEFRRMFAMHVGGGDDHC